MKNISREDFIRTVNGVIMLRYKVSVMSEVSKANALVRLPESGRYDKD